MAGGLGAPFTALEDDGLAGDDLGDEAAFAGGIGVENPGHVLGGGADIRGHDIDLGSDEGGDFLSEAAGESFLFAHAHFAGIAGDAAFATAIGETHEGAFPVHPHGEGGDFSDFDRGVEAEAAFDGAT